MLRRPGCADETLQIRDPTREVGEFGGCAGMQTKQCPRDVRFSLRREHQLGADAEC